MSTSDSAASVGAAAAVDVELRNYFPSFLWLVRDFSLELELNGKPISAREYLEKALTPVEGKGERIEGKNRIRQFIKQFFLDRDCFCLKRPVVDETKLQRINSLPLSELRPEYMEQVMDLKDRIFSKVEVKRIQGRSLNGSMILHLAQEYVHAINTGSVPTISTAWEAVVRLECEKALMTAAQFYQQSMEKQLKEDPNCATGMEVLAFLDLHRRTEMASVAILQAKGLGDEVSSGGFETKLKDQILLHFQKFYARNETNSQAFCEKALDDCSADLVRRWRSEDGAGEGVDPETLESEWLAVVQRYDKLAKGPRKDAVLCDRLLRASAGSGSLWESVRVIHGKKLQTLREVAQQKEVEMHQRAEEEYRRMEGILEKVEMQQSALVQSNKLLEEAKARLEEDLALKHGHNEDLIRQISELQAMLEMERSEYEQRLKGAEELAETEKATVAQQRETAEEEKQRLETEIEKERQAKEEMERRNREMQEELNANKKKKGCVIC